MGIPSSMGTPAMTNVPLDCIQPAVWTAACMLHSAKLAVLAKRMAASGAERLHVRMMLNKTSCSIHEQQNYLRT
jgi:hypothetical protein